MLAVASPPVRAQFELDLPGVTGVHQEATLVGEFYVPFLDGAQDATLRLVGVQALGHRGIGCPPYCPWRPSAVLAFELAHIAWPDTVPWLSGWLELPLESGNFDATMALGPHGGTAWPEGVHVFRLMIGSDDISICGCDDYAPASVSVYTAHLQAQPAVAAEASSWGAVKALYR